jgi:hypothetical protein
MRFLMSGNWVPGFLRRANGHRWTLLMALLSMAVLWFLSRHHSFVAMWVEGLGEIIETDLAMFGLSHHHISCSCQIGGLSLPLGQDPHFGPVWFYLYLPTLYLWFHEITSDPYVYRYTGILIFIANGWIFYYLARKYYRPSISFYSAAGFLTCPLFLLGSLTDYEFDNTMVLFTLLTALLFSQYLKSKQTIWLLASGLALGMIVVTRTQSLIWLVVPFLIYLVAVRPRLILDRWSQTKHKAAAGLGVLLMFGLGASPMIAYYIVCPQYNIFSYTVNTIFKGSFDASYMSMPARLAERLMQFWDFSLLNTWNLYDLTAANYVMALVWIICACILAVRWIRKRQPAPLLIMIPVVIALSVLTKGMVRQEHLLVLEPAVLLVLPAGLAVVEEQRRFRSMAHIAFVLVILGNITVAALGLQRWNQLRSSGDLDALVNHSDPVLLANHLSERFNESDRILYTNVGIAQYMRYMTAGRLFGEDIMDWYDVNAFLKSAKLSLFDRSKRRVFVAVSKERDGRRFQLQRTGALYNLLDQYNVPYEVTHLSIEPDNPRYDVIVIDRGVGLTESYAVTGSFVVSDVRDVRVILGSGGKAEVIGSVIGEGFRRSDAVRIDGELVVPTVFGNEHWITFSIPLEALGNKNAFVLEVIRVESLERSNSVTASFQR